MPIRVRGQWAKLAIVALVVLNVVLLIVLWQTRPLVGTPAAPVSATPLEDSEPSPSTTPRASAEPTEEADERPRSPQERQATRLLAINSEKVAWRATMAACGKQAVVEVTTDGGRRWRATKQGLPVVLRLKSYGSESVFAVGADGRCRARYCTIDSPGGEWQPDAGMLGETWHRDPQRRNIVNAPGGDRSRPCESGLADLAGLGTSNATALCTNGTLALTTDGGEDWQTFRPAMQVLAVNADDLGFVAAGRSSGCAGVAIALFGPDATSVGSGRGRCAPVGVEGASAVAVAVRGNLVWVWADDNLARSSDGGRTW